MKLSNFYVPFFLHKVHEYLFYCTSIIVIVTNFFKVYILFKSRVIDVIEIRCSLELSESALK